MNDEFVLEDPPIRNRDTQLWKLGAKTDVSEMLAFAKAHPGRWARVWTGGGYGAQNRVDLLKEAGCETRTVRLEPGRGNVRRLYVRWNGEGGEQ